MTILAITYNYKNRFSVHFLSEQMRVSMTAILPASSTIEDIHYFGISTSAKANPSRRKEVSAAGLGKTGPQQD